MADEVRKRSNWVGKDRTDLEKYIVDLDADMFNLYQEKSININFMKRYNLTIASTYGT